MSETVKNRGWVCALVAVGFAALGISGLVMLLHLPIGLDLKLLHVAAGIIFIAAGILHLALNWKTFAAHFHSRPAIITAVAAVVIAVALLFIGGPEGSGPHRNGQKQGELGIGVGGDFGNGRWGDSDNEGSGTGQ